jgi:hypothetical protein
LSQRRENRSWIKLAIGIGTELSSANAMINRLSLSPSGILNPGGSYFFSAMMLP